MNISVFGLGYVGAVTSGCLASQGHTVVGVDVAINKVTDMKQGRPPIVEPGLDDLLAQALDQHRLDATLDAADAVARTDASIVCVGTPSQVGGALDLQYVRHVTRQILEALRTKSSPHVLLFRSTMLPGSTRTLVRDLCSDLTGSGRLEVIYYPEFLREGTAVKDFQSPSLTVLGTMTGEAPSAAVQNLVKADADVTTWETSELVKYACNAFHATKVAFANEIGRVGRACSVDSRRVMEILCRDNRLNISPYYLKPGNPFGGSCLPKDVRALVHCARTSGVAVPVLESLIPSNDRHLQSLLEIIAASDHREIIILGLAFKANTDDLRESCMVEVAQHCLGRGYKIRIFDPYLNLASVVGANRRVIDTRMPHLASLLEPTLESAVGSAGLVIAAQRVADPAQLARALTPRHSVLDVNGWSELRTLVQDYRGFCW